MQETNGDVFVLDAEEGGRVYKFSAAGAPVDFASSGTNVIEGAGSSGGSEEEIAVDDSTGPDAGDIYVANNQTVQIYAASGAFLGELSGGEMCGVAVGTTGEVYVGIYPETVRRYTPATNPVTNSNETASIGGLSGVCNVAVDSAGDVFAAAYSGGVTKYDALQFGSLSATGTLVDAYGRTLAVDPTSGEVFINDENQIDQYDGTAEPPTREGTTGASEAGAISGSFGVAVDDSSGDVYAATAGVVEIFGPGILVASVSTEGATGVTGSGATLHGSIQPAGTEVTGCVFEYGTEEGSLEQSVPCVPTPPYTGSSPVAVSAQLSGLAAGTAYRYRVAASNTNGAQTGEEQSFQTSGPVISGESFSDVGSTGAVLGADIAPNGEPTTYRVEYGTSEAYGYTTSPIGIGGGEAPVSVVSRLSELQPNTTYHGRFAAQNAGAATTGPDFTFTTHPLSSSGLPDDRGYEMVTPVEDSGSEPYYPERAGYEGEESILSPDPVVAAESGEAVAYAGGPAAGGNGNQGNGGGNQFLAKRNPEGGWTESDIQPSGYRTPLFWAFSSNLDKSILTSKEALTPAAPDGHYRDLYVRDNEDASYLPLSTVKPPNRSATEFGAVTNQEYVNEDSLGEDYAGSSADFSHILFEANDTLTSDSVDPGELANNLYESVNGQPRSVNVLPDGTPAPNASFGSQSELGVDFSRVISADGARVFWTDLSTGSLYVRENGVGTALIAEAATYLTASTDGSKVLYTKAGDLYEDNLETDVTRDLAPDAQLLGLVGASEDLEYVYFAAEGVLSPGATAGESNLYLLHEGKTTHIATLASPSEEDAEVFGNNGAEYFLPWQGDVGFRTAEVTPSGQGLVFMSKRSLTGYDNVSRTESRSDFEVYVYDASNDQLSCASCNPSGEPPASGTGLHQLGGLLPVSAHSTYQQHEISNDGDRVFFESAQELVPQAENGKLNVYEWERDGAGSCDYATGCIYLITNGASSTPSYLIDASATGNDVFIMTRSQLVSADKNEYNDIYDARVGATEAAVPTRCTGTGCQGLPATPPVFATPASATFSGVGNFAPTSSPVSKPKPKPKPKKATPKCASTKAAKRKKGKKAAKQTRAKVVRCKAKKAATVVRHKSERGGR